MDRVRREEVDDPQTVPEVDIATTTPPITRTVQLVHSRTRAIRNLGSPLRDDEAGALSTHSQQLRELKCDEPGSHSVAI